MSEILSRPEGFEGETVILTERIVSFNLTDPVTISFQRDKELESLPLRFPDRPSLFEGGVISLKGICRLASEGAVVIEDYHVATTYPKLVLGLAGLALLAAYFLKSYRFDVGRLMWEKRGLA